MPTIPELDAQIRDLTRQRDIASLDAVAGVRDILEREDLVQAMEDLQAALEGLPSPSFPAEFSSVRNMAGNVLSTFGAARLQVGNEHARIQALIPADEPEE